MSKSGKATVNISRQQKILNALQGGLRTWDELRMLTKVNDDNLGFTIAELLSLRKIWTSDKSGARVYGIERRVGMVPRFHAQRRAEDLQHAYKDKRS